VKRHDLPLTGSSDERHGVEQSEGCGVGLRARNRRATPQRRAAHDGGVSIDVDRHVTGLQAREFEATGTDLFQGLCTGLLRSVSKGADEWAIASASPASMA
jgi:hypothetical protein